MLGSTHLLFSLLFGSFLFDYFHPGTLFLKIVFAALLMIGTFLPDLDLKFKFLEHRGLLHTIWPIVLLLIVNFFLQKQTGFSIIAMAIGYGSHLFADMLTPCGVAPIAPLHKKRIRGPVETGSVWEFGVSAIVFAILLMRI